MAGFSLTSKGLRDVAELITYCHRMRDAARAADEIENRLFRAFEEIASTPSIGHRRGDLTTKNVRFHYSKPYFILFRRVNKGIQVLRVAHRAQDLRKFL